MIDKEKFIRMNSDKKPTDNMAIKREYLLFYNKSEDRIGLEKFNFRDKTKITIFISDNVSNEIENIWDIGSFDIMKLLIEKYEQG